MVPLKQSIVFGGFARKGLAADQVIGHAAAAGFQSVEMLDRELWDTVRDHGMRVAIISGHRSLEDGLNRCENHDRIEQELRASIELAAANDIPAVICFSGNREGKSAEEGRDNTVEGLLRVKGAAEEKGVTLCLEPLNSRVDHPDYQCDRTPWGVAVCQATDSPRVKLLYDIYHMQIMEGDLIRTIRDNIDFIAHFHTAGNPGRNDLDEDQEIYYPAVARAIAGSGFQGYVGHEFTPKGDPLAAMQAAYDACNVEA